MTETGPRLAMLDEALHAGLEFYFDISTRENFATNDFIGVVYIYGGAGL